MLGPESVQLRTDLTFLVAPVRIDGTSAKCSRGKEVPLVKVVWSRGGVDETYFGHGVRNPTGLPRYFLGNLNFEGKILFKGGRI